MLENRPPGGGRAMPGLRRAVALDGNPFAILGRQLCPASYQFVTRAAKVSYHLLTSGGFGSASGLKIDIPPKNQNVQNSRTFRKFLTARPVNPPGCRKKYRRDTDVLPTRCRQGFFSLTKGLSFDSHGPDTGPERLPLKHRPRPLPRHGLTLGGPNGAAADHLGDLRHLEVVQLMPDRAIKHPPLVPATCPGDGDHRALDPPKVIA